MTLLITKYYRDGEIKDDEMGKARKTHGKEGK
jgi:hypothetical protein